MKNILSVKSFKKLMTIVVAAAVIVVLTFLISSCGKGTEPSSADGEVSFVFKVIKDGQTTEFNITSDEKYLANALVDEGLVEYSKSGMYTKINGIEANFDADGSWWCITENGAMTMYGMNQIEIKDGTSYEATYTK